MKIPAKFFLKTLYNKSIFSSQKFLDTYAFDEAEGVFAHELGCHASIYVSIHVILIATIIFETGRLEVLLLPYSTYPMILLLIIPSIFWKIFKRIAFFEGGE